jgi:plastocyanin
MSKLDRNPGPVVNRRGLLGCAAWAAAGVVCVAFVQISDGHIGLARGPNPTPQARTVTIGNFAFSPADLEVPAGTEVTWSNGDDIPHTIVATDGGPVTKSRPLGTDQKYTLVLNRPGTYRYFCSLHPHMTGTIIVR